MGLQLRGLEGAERSRLIGSARASSGRGERSPGRQGGAGARARSDLGEAAGAAGRIATAGGEVRVWSDVGADRHLRNAARRLDGSRAVRCVGYRAGRVTCPPTGPSAVGDGRLWRLPARMRQAPPPTTALHHAQHLAAVLRRSSPPDRFRVTTARSASMPRGTVAPPCVRRRLGELSPVGPHGDRTTLGVEVAPSWSTATARRWGHRWQDRAAAELRQVTATDRAGRRTAPCGPPTVAEGRAPSSRRWPSQTGRLVL